MSQAARPGGPGRRHRRGTTRAAIELADEARADRERPPSSRASGVETKLDRSLVTDADQTVERRLRELIGRWFPEHGVLGEEYPPTRPESAFQWILDPIDGTEEFVHGIPTFGTMLALHHRGMPLVGVIDHAALDLRVTAGRGLGTFRNGRRIRLPDAAGDPRPEAVRLVLSARVNFIAPRRRGAPLRGADARVPEPPDLSRGLRAHRGRHRRGRRHGRHAQPASGTRPRVQVLIEEAGGRYAVVRDFPAADGGRILSAVFGQPAVVDRLVALFHEGGAPRAARPAGSNRPVEANPGERGAPPPGGRRRALAGLAGLGALWRPGPAARRRDARGDRAARPAGARGVHAAGVRASAASRSTAATSPSAP